MHDPFGAALDVAFDMDQPCAHHFAAKRLHDLRPDDNIGDAGFILNGEEHHALGAGGALAHGDDARHFHAASVGTFLHSTTG
ncbi:hypothetical protein D3C81_1913470 [compost metagenome]